MAEVPFWRTKALADMSHEEWESLCDGCGQCCLHKLQDEETNEIHFTNVACNLLDLTSCQCSHYENRFDYEKDCIKLTQENLVTFSWLPPTCAYRLVHEGKDLPLWHPLRAGSKALMHSARISVRAIAVHEKEVSNWNAHIIRSSYQEAEQDGVNQQAILSDEDTE